MHKTILWRALRWRRKDVQTQAQRLAAEMAIDRQTAEDAIAFVGRGLARGQFDIDAIHRYMGKTGVPVEDIGPRVMELPEPQRTVMCGISLGKTYEEIAEAMGISREEVMMMATRGYAMLMGGLTDNGSESAK